MYSTRQKTFPISFSTMAFGSNELRRNREVPARTILRKRHLPFRFVLFCFFLFQLGQVAEELFWCLEDGVRSGHCIPLTACHFRTPCSRFIPGAASVEAAWREMKRNATKRNPTGSKPNSTTVKNGNKWHGFIKRNQTFLETFFDAYCTCTCTCIYRMYIDFNSASWAVSW